MAIREDIVSSAVSFLQDPNVATSPVENKLSFLRSKNLTQEEIDAAFARAGSPPPPAAAAAPAPSAPVQQQPYYPQHAQPPPYGWQEPPPEPPKRDWRDWFIMATVVGGVGYGLYFISKRYLYPLVAPPTPEKLDQDKTTVDEQFEKAFATLEQLSKDTETLKESEAARTAKLDKALEDLEAFVRESKSASRRQEDETERLREDIKTINATIPRSMATNKEFTEDKLKEISNEIKSLRSLISQRMSTPAPSPAAGPAATYNSGASAHLRTPSTNAASVSPVATPSTEVKENGSLNGNGTGSAQDENKTSTPTPAPSKQDYISSLGGRSSPFGSGAPAVKASIPAWQMAATTPKASDSAAGSSSSAGAAGSSSST
ncbi:putative peroxin 14 [Rosellinia necatrix]|uniref:Peroxisomal membrane protein PEX14 n=1 Tax=Rosellinia necatrix TaxID=77044 RepID=A0A1W2TG16_ROSNE|nr:putative peroxin 14 [Rosellinia necatrix]